MSKSVIPAVGVGAVVFDERGRVLLVRRGQPPAQGLWSLPGGKLEPGETLTACCRREVLEETGLAIQPGPVIALADRRIEAFHYVIVDFLAMLEISAEPIPASDVADARWVPTLELADYDLVAGIRAVIEHARAGLLAGQPFGLTDSDGAGGLFIADSR